jgi:hypothetical protein
MVAFSLHNLLQTKCLTLKTQVLNEKVLLRTVLSPENLVPGSEIRELTATGINMARNVLLPSGWDKSQVAWVYTFDEVILAELRSMGNSAASTSLVSMFVSNGC